MYTKNWRPISLQIASKGSDEKINVWLPLRQTFKERKKEKIQIRQSVLNGNSQFFIRLINELKINVSGSLNHLISTAVADLWPKASLHKKKALLNDKFEIRPAMFSLAFETNWQPWWRERIVIREGEWRSFLVFIVSYEAVQICWGLFYSWGFVWPRWRENAVNLFWRDSENYIRQGVSYPSAHLNGNTPYFSFFLSFFGLLCERPLINHA